MALQLARTAWAPQLASEAQSLWFPWADSPLASFRQCGERLGLWFAGTCWGCSPRQREGSVRRRGRKEEDSIDLNQVSLSLGASRSTTHTGLADGLFTAGKPEGIYGKLAADGASEFDGDVVGRERAVENGQLSASATWWCSPASGQRAVGSGQLATPT